jgi:hypothetical protein
MRILLKSVAVCLLLVLPSQFVSGHEHHEHGEHGHASSADAAVNIEKNLAELSVEDRQLAEAQRYCPVMPEVVLGEMGTPIKMDIDGHAIVVCCEGCVEQAESDPAATLASWSKIEDRMAAEAEIEASLAAMEPQDREAATAQGYCPVMTESALGSMGPPIKVNVAGEAVYVCCKGCGKKAQANAEKTLATVASLKEQVAQAAEVEASFAALAPTDRGPARAQGFCAVMPESPLGSMGAPVKVEVGDKAVYLCCAGCRRKALANPEQTLSTVAMLQSKVAAEASK